MATIPQIKRQYPQYKNIPDEQLADAIYKKFYQGKVSLEEYKNKVLPTKDQRSGIEDTDILSAGEGVAGTPSTFQFGRDEAGGLENYLNSDDFQRLAVEVFGAVGGLVTAGTLTAARTAIGAALRSKPLLTRSIFAGTGESLGAGAAQTFDPKESVVREMLRGFATGATAEVIGASIPRILGKVGFKGIKFDKDAELAEQIVKSEKEKIEKGVSRLTEEEIESARKGIITPGIGSGNRVVDVLENLAEKSLIGGKGIIDARKGGQILVSRRIADTVDEFGKISKEDYGGIIQNLVINNFDTFKAAANVLYKKVDDLTKPVIRKKIQETGRVPSSVVDEFGKPISRVQTQTVDEIVEGGVDISSAKKVAKELLDETASAPLLSSPARRIAQQVLKNNNQITFKDANFLRSTLLGIARTSTEQVAGQSVRFAAKLSKELTKNIDQATVSPAAREAYKEAQEFYRVNREIYNEKLLRAVVDKDPEKVYDALIKKGNPSSLRRLMKVIDETKDPKLRQEYKFKLKGSVLSDIARESQNSTGRLDGKRMLKEFNKFGDNVTDQIFTKKEVSTIRDLFAALAAAQRKTVGEGVPGGVFIQLGQAGAGLQLLTQAFVAADRAITTASATILFAPAGIGKVFTNPKAVAFLKKGFNLRPGSDAAIKNFTRFVSYLTSVEVISADDADDVIRSLKE